MIGDGISQFVRSTFTLESFLHETADRIKTATDKTLEIYTLPPKPDIPVNAKPNPTYLSQIFATYKTGLGYGFDSVNSLDN